MNWEALLPGLELRLQEPMARHTTMCVGGPADCLVLPRSEGELLTVLRSARAASLPVTVIGNGSNLIVRDGGLRGLVVKLTSHLQEMTATQQGLRVQAGAAMRSIGNLALAQGLSGFEALHGIPGSVGGAVYMNAGAYGQEMAQVVHSVRALTPEGEIVEMNGEAMGFGYRTSEAQRRGLVILDTELHLSPGDAGAIQERMREYAQARSSKQPLELPSAGSVFKRPPGHFAGQLIEASGLKGTRVGGAQVSEKHAGFIVNTGGATAPDVLRLIEHVIEVVRRDHGITLEPEVRLIGEDL